MPVIKDNFENFSGTLDVQLRFIAAWIKVLSNDEYADNTLALEATQEMIEDNIYDGGMKELEYYIRRYTNAHTDIDVLAIRDRINEEVDI